MGNSPSRYPGGYLNPTLGAGGYTPYPFPQPQLEKKSKGWGLFKSEKKRRQEALDLARQYMQYTMPAVVQYPATYYCE